MDKQRIKEFEDEHRELTCKWNELSKYIVHKYHTLSI